MAELHSLNSLIDRLEAAVSRLESTQSSPLPPPPSPSPSPSLASPPHIPPSVSDFDSLINTSVARLLSSSEKIGGQVLQASQLLKQAFVVERGIVLAISKCKRPGMAGIQKLVQPLFAIVSKASALTEGKRTDAYNHLKTVAESLSALSWVVFTGKDCGMSFPATHVEESWQAAEFYNNKVLVEYRNKDVNHVEWARAMKELFVPGLRDYTKNFHVTGPAWNMNGVNFDQFAGGNTTPAPPTSLKTPPPPPPGAPPTPPQGALPASELASGSKPGMNAVFQDINKGQAITSGLRKVTDDMKSKNRTDRTGAVPAGTSSKGSVSSGGVSLNVKSGSPKFELQMDRKWVVENQVGNRNLIISKCNAWQSVYIFGCKNSVIQIQGKVNNITVDKCIKTGVVFKDVVAACEIVNCTSVEVQCQGTAPSITVDNTTGCQLYLSKNSLAASITTAKSNEINVLVPGATDDADLVEQALPEQFLNVFKDGVFVTTPVSHSGG